MSQWLGAGHASGLRRDPTTFLEGHDRMRRWTGRVPGYHS